MSQDLRYNPQRILSLQDRALAVVNHLDAATSHDPAASGALAVARSVRTRLCEGLLPTVRRIAASDAMLTWTAEGAAAGSLLDSASGGGWLTLLRAGFTSGPERALGLELAGDAAALAVAGEWNERDAAALSAALDAAPPEVLATFFTEVTGSGFAEYMLATSRRSPGDASGAPAAAAARTAFAHAAAQGLLPPSFMTEVIDRIAVEHAARADGDVSGLVLSYLFHGEQLPTDVLVEAGEALYRVETDPAISERIAKGHPEIFWRPVGAVSRFEHSTLTAEFLDEEQAEGRRPTIVGEAVLALDPMYALVDQLSRDGAAGRTLLTDADGARRVSSSFATYLFGTREVMGDGGRRVTAVAATAAAGPEIVVGAPDDDMNRAAAVASGFVNTFGWRHADVPVAERSVMSVSVATILGRHMPSVHQAALTTQEGDLRGGSTQTYSYSPFGDEAHGWRAQMDPDYLGNMVDIAVTSDDAMVVLGAATRQFETRVAQATAARVVQGELDGGALDAILGQAGRLEGMFIAHIGGHAQYVGRTRDEAAGRWIGALESAVSVPRSLVTTSVVMSAVIDGGTDGGFDALRKRFASAEKAAIAGAEKQAEATVDGLELVWQRAFVEAGALRLNSAVDFFDDEGNLRPWEDLDDFERDEFEAAVRNPSANGAPTLNTAAISAEVKLAQQRFFVPGGVKSVG